MFRRSFGDDVAKPPPFLKRRRIRLHENQSAQPIWMRQGIEQTLKTTERMADEVDAILTDRTSNAFQIVDKRRHRKQFGLLMATRTSGTALIDKYQSTMTVGQSRQ